MPLPAPPTPPVDPKPGKAFDIADEDVPSLPHGVYEILATERRYFFEVKTNGHGADHPVAEHRCLTIYRLKRL